MAASETEIDLNDDEEPVEPENENPGSPEVVEVEENGQDSPDLGPSRQLHQQRMPSRGEVVKPDENSDNGKDTLEANHSQNRGVPLFFQTNSHP